MNHGTPRAETEVDEDLVRRLLREQHADLAERPLAALASGWDNFMFRLGEDLVLRLPRRTLAAELVRNEQRWLAELAERLPLPVPAPVRVGRPGCGYPWSWSVLPWLPGRPANEAPPAADQALPLASFLRALHRPAPDDAPANPRRGCPLADRAAETEERLARLRALGEATESGLERAWRTALTAPPTREAPWLHGDLHARNVLVEGGAITGVVDWGDVTSGDAATDLASIWGLLEDPAARRAALDDYGADKPTRARALGWAVTFGAVLLDTGRVDDPRHAEMGRHTLRRVAEDAG